MKVDLGCGENCKEGFVGLDIKKYNGKVKIIHDLKSLPLPFKNNSIDEFYSKNVFDELNEPERLIEDCYRCLKQDGLLEFEVIYCKHPLADTPRYKSRWSLNCIRLFSKACQRMSGCNWKKVKVEFTSSGLVPKWLVKLNPWLYEKHLASILPINSLKFILQKTGV